MSLVIEAVGLTREFEAPLAPIRVLKSVNLQLHTGECLAVMGPSGVGKSTLLSILGTLDRPTSGSLRLEGKDPFLLDERRLSVMRNRRIGFVFQDHYLLPHLSALENVVLPALAEKTVGREQLARGEQLLEQVGLAERKTYAPSELSGGERQRVAIARALINEPVLLLCDEPTGNLDEQNGLAIADLLLDLQRDREMTMVLVTHDTVFADRFDKRVRMEDGVLSYPVGNCAT